MAARNGYSDGKRFHLPMRPEPECPQHPTEWWEPVPPARHSALADRHAARLELHLGKRRKVKICVLAVFWQEALCGQLDDDC